MRFPKIPNDQLRRLTVEEHRLAAKIPLIVILDNVRSLNNIGSVFRSADAFLIEKIYLCGITAQPPHRDIQKTALGATESVDWEYATSTLELVNNLRDSGVIVMAVEQAQDSIWLQEFKAQKDRTYALIFGNEVKGVDQQVVSVCDGVVEIPQYGTKHSLNISVSAGVVMWDFFLKLDKASR